MDLVERHTQLAELNAALRDAQAGRGCVVLVSGEAGAGKTTLVRRFAEDITDQSRVLWGMCDDLATPRPLGPFRDMFRQLTDPADRAGGAASAGELLDAILNELARSRFGTVVVVEDAHWADAATLDGIRFIGRRVRRQPAVLVVTVRGDEVPADHPLRAAFGAIPADDIRRVRLPALSRHGVAMLAGRDDIDELYRRTGGNPFYVTEVLAAPDTAVPETIQDAVMARAGRLSLAGLATVETVAVIPGRAERWILDEGEVAEGLDEAVRLGMLVTDGETVRFPHEVARQAIEGQFSAEARAAINARVLGVLVGRDVDAARLTHHAERAGDAAAVARFAPEAARAAARLDSHREAVAHYRQAVARAQLYPPDDLAVLWREYAFECTLTGAHMEAARAVTESARLLETMDDPEGLGLSLTMQSEALWYLGRGAEARTVLDRAGDVLDGAPPGPALAWFAAQQARLAMVDWRSDDAVTWGNQAVALARRLDDLELEVHALNTVGTARGRIAPFRNAELLDSLRLAQSHGLSAAASRAYVNLVSAARERLDPGAAMRYLEEGLDFCAEHDLLTALAWLLGERAELHLDQGRWADAEEDAERSLEGSDTRNATALVVLGLLQARRGDDSAAAHLTQAQRIADEIRDNQVVVPVSIARLEAAWLAQDTTEVRRLAAGLAELAPRTSRDSGASISMLWLWLNRVGLLDNAPAATMEPYSLQIAGHCREAAAAWAELGYVYAQADALADAREPEPLLEALDILDRLGARPRAAMVRARLTKLGVGSVPRGPRRTTRASPAGLTARQTEVLRLLAEGMTYQEIAETLYLSVKTVDHHAAAVRAKLQARTRDEAVAAARRRGVLPSHR